MFNFKNTKISRKILSVSLTAMIMVCGLSTTAFASSTTESQNESIVFHSKEWVTPFEQVETTIYDLGDGFTATVKTTSSYGMLRASGTKTDTQEIEIKDGKIIAATVKVTGSFSFDGSKATVTSASQSRSVKSGYSETYYSKGQSNSSNFSSAYVSATLTVKGGSKEFTKTAKVTCGKNG